jgi:hypothetical protein
VRRLTGSEAEKAREWIAAAADAARPSSCLRSRCGAIIVRDDMVIGFGYNSPPGDRPPRACLKDEITESEMRGEGTFKSDKTCCVHAEQRALLFALEDMPAGETAEDYLRGAVVYFSRVDSEGRPVPSGAPYCTVCSKLYADVGIGWCLWHREEVWGEEGIYRYGPREYNKISFRHHLRGDPVSRDPPAPS